MKKRYTDEQITTHYSAVEIGELIEAAERVSFERGSTPTLTLLKSPNAKTEGGCANPTHLAETRRAIRA